MHKLEARNKVSLIKLKEDALYLTIHIQLSELSKINYIDYSKCYLTNCGNVCYNVVQIRTSVYFQTLAFDFLLGKAPGGKET